MTTDTDHANAALGLLGEMPITLITDATSKPARVCNAFAAAARIEVLRALHLSEALAISALDASAKEAAALRLACKIAVPLLGSQEVQSKMEQLYAARIQEAKVRILHSSALNGKILAMIGNDLAKSDLSPTMLTEFSTTFQADATKEVLRLTHAVSEATAYGSITDPLLLEAIDARQAAKIAGALALPSLPAFEQVAAVRLQDAKTRALHSSALNGKILAMIGADLAKADLSPAMLTEFSTTYQADATKEVLRLTHAASEATLYAAITDPLMLEAIDTRQAAKIAAALTLPSTQALEELFTLRLQETKVRVLHTSALNGKVLAMIGNDLAKIDISASMLTEFGLYQAEATKEVLRLTHAASEATAYASITDPLVTEAIDVRQALKIATALTLPSAAALEQQFALRLQEAKVRVLHTSALNGKILAMIGSDLAKVDISATMLTEFGLYQAEATKEVLRLTYATDETTLYAALTDTLIIEAIDVRQALKIATALTLPSAAALEQQFALRLQECKLRILQASALNGKILAMIGNDLSKIDITPTMLTEFGTYQVEATKEVLRLTHAASEATLYAAITDPLMLETIDLRQALKIATALTLPSAAALEQQFALRLQENKVRLLHTSALNGKILAMIGNDLAKMDISATMLTEFGLYQAEATKEVLRLTHATDETTLYAALTDTLLIEAIDVRQALKIATALTLPSAAALEQQFALRIQEARVRSINSSAINGQIMAMLGNDLSKFDLSPAMLTLYGTTYQTEAAKEVLRLTHAAVETTAYGSITDPLMLETIDVRHALKIATALTLPSAAALEQQFTLRLQENKVRLLHTSALNGKVLAMIGNDLSKIDITPTMLTEFGLYQAEATKEVLRLTHQASEATAYGSLTDTLMIEAIDVRQALKIATALTLPSAAALEQQFALRIQEARVRDINSSAINGQILAMLGADLSKYDLSPAMMTLYGVTYQTEATKEVLRLTHAAVETTAYGSLTDSLMLETIDIRHALKIATALTLPSAAALEQQFALRLQENKVRLLHTSGLNGQILAMIGNDLAKVDLSPTMLTLFVTTYAAEALKEVLRMGRWGCAIKRVALAATTAPTVGDYLYKYSLPATCLRVLEVNGEAVTASSEYFEIEGAFLLSNEDTVWIRYIDAITLAACDPLLANAINTRHTAKIAAALTLPSTPALEGLFQKRLAEARQQDAQENGSAEKPSWGRVFGRSRLLGARRPGRNPLRMEDF